MIRRFRLSAILAAALSLSACSTSKQAQIVKATPAVAAAANTVAADTQTITNRVNNLPPQIRQDLAGFAQKHPEMDADFAKALNDGAGFLSDLPSPTEINILLLWTKFSPKWAAAAQEFEGIYAASYNALPGSASTLSALAQVLKQAPPAPAQTAVV